MNILQIIQTAPPPINNNRADGAGRVVTQLCQHFVNKYNDRCFLGYFLNNEEDIVTSVFSEAIQLSFTIDTKTFSDFVLNNDIDVIQINLPPAKRFIQPFLDICKVAESLCLSVVYNPHIIPGCEMLMYGSAKEILYCITHRKPCHDSVMNWCMNIFRPADLRFLKKRGKKKYNIAYEHCAKIVLFSEPYINRYLDIVEQTDRDRFSVIPNPLTFSEFLPEDEVKTKKKKVIFVGRLVESQKRVSAILKIWKYVEQNSLLDDWTLSIVGNGKDMPFYLWLTEKYKLKRVCFEGRQDPKPYYKESAIMVSTSAIEGWPMVLMEAMPMGCCCLSFDSYEAINDIIEDGSNGRIIPYNDIKGYAKCLMELMLNDKKRIKMGINAIQSSHRFTMDIIGEQWHHLFIELVER